MNGSKHVRNFDFHRKTAENVDDRIEQNKDDMGISSSPPTEQENQEGFDKPYPSLKMPGSIGDATRRRVNAEKQFDVWRRNIQTTPDKELEKSLIEEFKEVSRQEVEPETREQQVVTQDFQARELTMQEKARAQAEALRGDYGEALQNLARMEDGLTTDDRSAFYEAYKEHHTEELHQDTGTEKSEDLDQDTGLSH